MLWFIKQQLIEQGAERTMASDPSDWRDDLDEVELFTYYLSAEQVEERFQSSFRFSSLPQYRELFMEYGEKFRIIEAPDCGLLDVTIICKNGAHIAWGGGYELGHEGERLYSIHDAMRMCLLKLADCVIFHQCEERKI